VIGGKQLCFSYYEVTIAKKQTKTGKIPDLRWRWWCPWQELFVLINPYKPKKSKKKVLPS